MKNAKEHKIQLSVNIHGLPTELVPKISVEKVLKFSSTKSKIQEPNVIGIRLNFQLLSTFSLEQLSFHYVNGRRTGHKIAKNMLLHILHFQTIKYRSFHYILIGHGCAKHISNNHFSFFLTAIALFKILVTPFICDSFTIQ